MKNETVIRNINKIRGSLYPDFEWCHVGDLSVMPGGKVDFGISKNNRIIFEGKETFMKVSDVTSIKLKRPRTGIEFEFCLKGGYLVHFDGFGYFWPSILLDKNYIYWGKEAEAVITDTEFTLNKEVFEGYAVVNDRLVPTTEDGYDRELVIPNIAKTVAPHAFENCTFLEKVSFEEGIETISACAFRCCGHLETIVLPVSVREIKHEVFPNGQRFNVYYEGSMADRIKMEINADHGSNESFRNATWHYNSKERCFKPIKILKK